MELQQLTSRINSLKQQYNNGVQEKSKAEGRLEELNRKKAELDDKCKQLGIDKESISNIISSKENELMKLICEAESLIANSQNTLGQANDTEPF